MPRGFGSDPEFVLDMARAFIRGFKDAGVDSLPREKRELYNWQRRSQVLVKNI